MTTFSRKLARNVFFSSDKTFGPAKRFSSMQEGAGYQRIKEDPHDLIPVSAVGFFFGFGLHLRVHRRSLSLATCCWQTCCNQPVRAGLLGTTCTGRCSTALERKSHQGDAWTAARPLNERRIHLRHLSTYSPQSFLCPFLIVSSIWVNTTISLDSLCSMESDILWLLPTNFCFFSCLWCWEEQRG